MNKRERVAAENTIPTSTPCRGCSHTFGRHDRIENTADPIARYRCTADGCYCGQQYEPIAAAVSPDATEEELMAAMQALGREHDRRVERANMQRLGNLFRRPSP